MKVYFYDESTKEFVAEGNAFTDPRASERLGKDVWLLPANATFDEPPAAVEGKAIVFADGWQLVDDNRGKEAVNAARGLFTVDYIGSREGDTVLTDETIAALETGEKVIRDGEVVDRPAEEKEAEARMQRNSLLADSDKYMISDFPVTEEERAEYAAYRQYLRDYPASADFPAMPAKSFEEWKGA